MMRFVTFALMFASCVLLINGQFSKNLDNLNVDMILKNDRILSNYLRCVLDKGWSLGVKRREWILICFRFRSRTLHERRA